MARQYDNVDLGSSVRVVNSLDPANPQDAATKAYVDSRRPATPSKVELSSPVSITTQFPIPILSGSFTPLGTSGRLTVAGSGQCTGTSWMSFDLLTGQVAFPLYQGTGSAGNGLNPAAGVADARLGTVMVDQQSVFGRPVVLTGLTPGTPLNWTVMASITAGSSVQHPLPGAYGLAVMHDRSKMYVIDHGNNQVAVVNLGGSSKNQSAVTYPTIPNQMYANSTKCFIPVGTGPQRGALTGGKPASANSNYLSYAGSRLVVPNGGAHTVSVINTANETVTSTWTYPTNTRTGAATPTTIGIAMAVKSSSTATATASTTLSDSSAPFKTTAGTLGGVGTYVEGPGIPAGTRISAVTNTTTATLSNSVTTSASAGFPVFFSLPYILDYSNFCAFSMDIVTGTFYPGAVASGGSGAGITMGAIGNPSFATALPDGSEVYVTMSDTDMYYINTATNVATRIASVGLNVTFDVDAMPDSSAVWVTDGGTNSCKIGEIVTATHTPGVTGDVSPNFGGNPAVVSIAIDPLGLTCWCGFDNGQVNQWWVANPNPQGGGGGTPKGKITTAAGAQPGANMRGTAVDYQGYIYFADGTNNNMFEYPGGFGQIATTTAFVSEFLDVTWEDTV